MVAPATAPPVTATAPDAAPTARSFLAQRIHCCVWVSWGCSSDGQFHASGGGAADRRRAGHLWPRSFLSQPLVGVAGCRSWPVFSGSEPRHATFFHFGVSHFLSKVQLLDAELTDEELLALVLLAEQLPPPWHTEVALSFPLHCPCGAKPEPTHRLPAALSKKGRDPTCSENGSCFQPEPDYYGHFFDICSVSAEAVMTTQRWADMEDSDSERSETSGGPALNTTRFLKWLEKEGSLNESVVVELFERLRWRRYTVHADVVPCPFLLAAGALHIEDVVELYTNGDPLGIRGRLGLFYARATFKRAREAW